MPWTFVLPSAAASWWVVIVLAVLGAGVGVWLTRVLAHASYRSPEERHKPLPRHTWWLVIAVALAWASLTFRVGGQAQWSLLPAYLYLGVIGAALTLINLDTNRLPDGILLPSYPIALALLLVPTMVTGQWPALLRAVLVGSVLFAGFFVLAAVSRAMGLACVKLAGVLGLLLGWLGWGPGIVWIFVTFILCGVTGAVLLLTGRANVRSPIPFGPFMILGAWVALMFPVQLLI